MSESTQFTPYIPEDRWSGQVEIPPTFRDMSPHEQAARLRAMAGWTVDVSTETYEAEAADGRRIYGHPLMYQLGGRALAGAHNMAFQASLGVEDTFLAIVR